MLQILGYMIAAYGIARLIQTSAETKNTIVEVVGYIGAAALFFLAVLLTDRASDVSNVLGSL